MVNTGLPGAARSQLKRIEVVDSRGIMRVCCVNKFLSKRGEFSENTLRILIEYAQKREQPFQSCLLVLRHAAS
jgi:hypothetical protein